MRKYTNHPLLGMVLIHRSFPDEGSVGPKRSSTFCPVGASFNSKIDRRAAWPWPESISERVAVSYTVTDQNSLPGTGVGTTRRYDWPPSRNAPVASRVPSQYSEPA